MALDRIYIECAHCGERRTILRLGLGGGVENIGQPWGQENLKPLLEWIEEHAKHNPVDFVDEFGAPEKWFKLKTETA